MLGGRPFRRNRGRPRARTRAEHSSQDIRSPERWHRPKDESHEAALAAGRSDAGAACACTLRKRVITSRGTRPSARRTSKGRIWFGWKYNRYLHDYLGWHPVGRRQRGPAAESSRRRGSGPEHDRRLRLGPGLPTLASTAGSTSGGSSKPSLRRRRCWFVGPGWRSRQRQQRHGCRTWIFCRDVLGRVRARRFGGRVQGPQPRAGASRGETPADWRKSVWYYHYYEYPGSAQALRDTTAS